MRSRSRCTRRCGHRGRPGRGKRRGATTNTNGAERPTVFAVVEPKAGRHFNRVTPNRSAEQFAQVLRFLADQYGEARTIHLVMDNLNIHGSKSLTNTFGLDAGQRLWERFTVHYTPKHGSWLNQAEIELSLFSRQCLGKRRLADLATLERESRAWNERVDRARLKIHWRFDREAARRKFGYDQNQITQSET